MLVDDLYTLLRVVLPDDVPLLRPHELLLPAEWQEVDQADEPIDGGEEGMHVYLRQRAPSGYVQLFDSSGLLGYDLRSLNMIQVDVLGTSDQQVGQLVTLIEQAAHSTPLRPTRFRLFTDARYERQPVILRATILFQATKIIPLPGGN